MVIGLGGFMEGVEEFNLFYGEVTLRFQMAEPLQLGFPVGARWLKSLCFLFLGC